MAKEVATLDEPTAQHSRANVLLVDDRPENLMALEAVLEPLDHNLVRASSGEEALRHLLEEDFSVILLDVQMPGMDGFDTAKEIKNRDKTKDIPIIFLTAISREPRHALRGYSEGAVDYISKPYDPNALRAKVSVFVELHEKSQLLKKQAAELERSNQELQQFAYITSHDLQEPLRVVCGYLDLLKSDYSDKLDEDAMTYINSAVGNAERMQALIEALLKYSRVGSGGWAPERTDANMMLKQAMDNLAMAIEDAEAKITTGELPVIAASPSLIVQLFQNLIGNALKFRRSEEAPRVDVSAEREGDRWIFRVQDNGIGFELGQAERLFEIFQRLHAANEYPGTGIGLAICKKIVEQHGGRIWTESNPGEGAIFYFSMPRWEGK